MLRPVMNVTQLVLAAQCIGDTPQCTYGTVSVPSYVKKIKILLL